MALRSGTSFIAAATTRFAIALVLAWASFDVLAWDSTPTRIVATSGTAFTSAYPDAVARLGRGAAACCAEALATRSRIAGKRFVRFTKS